MTVNVLSAVFLSKYDFTGISSVLGIIVILKNKTVPNQTLSRMNGMMGLFSSHTVIFHLSPTLLLTCERGGTMSAYSLGGAAFLSVVLGILSELMGS